MSDGARSGHRPRRLAKEDDPPADEDFLFHLSRGGELLVQNRVVEAKEELEKALEVRPQDAQGQDLLAGVYFRLGVYPTAIKLWRRLAEQFPEDVVLRVNLGLSLFKTGQPEEAREHLEHALALEPDHERAWGYLGLTLWRLGALEEAREAFLRGGQASMARRMEEQVLASTAPPPEMSAERSALRDAVSEGADRLGQAEVELSVEAERPVVSARGTAWRVLETGAGLEAPLAPPSAAEPAPQPATELARLPDGQSLGIGPGGELILDARTSVSARLGGLVALRGALHVQPVERRARGRSPDVPLGGSEDPILRWHGPVLAVLRAPDGLLFHPLHVADAHLYVREDTIAAFDDALLVEHGELISPSGARMDLVSFRGEGTVVLRLARAPLGLEVRREEDVHVDVSALLGWTGRLFPSEPGSFRPASTTVSLRGQGIVLLT